MDRPYRVMRDYRYFYVGFDRDAAINHFKLVTADAASYYGDMHMTDKQPMVVALDFHGHLAGTLYGVSIEEWSDANKLN